MNAIQSKFNLRVLPALAATLLLCGCGGNGTFSPTVQNTGPAVVSISITSPNPSTTTPGGTLRFTAVVTGTSNKAVDWTAQLDDEDTARPKDSLISSDGVFSAQTLGTYTITAQSEADPTKTATATATVVASNTGLTGTIQSRPK